jgi:hypothetical protein
VQQRAETLQANFADRDADHVVRSAAIMRPEMIFAAVAAIVAIGIAISSRPCATGPSAAS